MCDTINIIVPATIVENIYRQPNCQINYTKSDKYYVAYYHCYDLYNIT